MNGNQHQHRAAVLFYQVKRGRRLESILRTQVPLSQAVSVVNSPAPCIMGVAINATSCGLSAHSLACLASSRTLSAA